MYGHTHTQTQTDTYITHENKITKNLISKMNKSWLNKNQKIMNEILQNFIKNYLYSWTNCISILPPVSEYPLSIATNTVMQTMTYWSRLHRKSVQVDLMKISIWYIFMSFYRLSILMFPYVLYRLFYATDISRPNRWYISFMNYYASREK